MTPFFAAAVSGFLLTISFPDTGLAFIAGGALVPLLIVIKRQPWKKAFQTGFVMGLTHFLSLLYWILPTLRTYGCLSLVLALPVLLLLAGYLALYPALFCAMMRWSPVPSAPERPGGIPGAWFPLKAAVVWVGLEFTRAHLFTGFPWGLVGYSQYAHLHLIQIADITGVYGVSFVLILLNGTLTTVWNNTLEWKRHPDTADKKALCTAMAGAVILSAFVWGPCLWYGQHRLNTVGTAMARAPRRILAVIQGNIPQSDKWDKRYKADTITTYCRLSAKAAAETLPDLIIWPETALPFYYPWDQDMSRQVDSCIRQTGTWFLIGNPAMEAQGSNDFRFFNRATMLTSRAMVTATYDKVHLVPFGEYVPFGKYLTFLDKLTSQAGDFSPGPEDAPPLAFGGGTAGVLICFEIIFPDRAAAAVNNGATVLVTMTNDAWFGRSSAAMQHFSMAVFRAVETRRAVARAANTGISGFIAPNGRITATTALFETATLTRSVAMGNTIPFYTRYGDLFAWTCLAITWLGLWRKSRNKSV